MNINEKHYTAIWLKQDDNKTIQIIDQTKLPFSFEIKDLKTVDDIYGAIKNMEVRGAPLIGITAAYGMYLACIEAAKTKTFDNKLRQFADKLRSSRPTAVNLFFAIDLMLTEIGKEKKVENKIEKALHTANKYFEDEINNFKKIGEAGLHLIENISKKKKGKTVNILTHCNAGWIACGDYGTATAPVYKAFDKGLDVHVWVDETRPRNQGSRLTAWELGMHGVPYTIVADNTGGHLMQLGLVDIVIVGSDRTASNGDVANKIGTYLKALAANDNNIPFYVALPSSTIDWNLNSGKDIEIEQRHDDEMKYIEGNFNNKIHKVRIVPDNANVANYAFDITPARLITGLITEKGICNAYKNGLKQLFPNKIIK